MLRSVPLQEAVNEKEARDAEADATATEGAAFLGPVTFHVETVTTAGSLEASAASAESWQLYKREAWSLGVLAGPLVVQQLVVFSTGLVSVAFVGRLGEFELSVIVLSNAIFTCTGQVSIMGMASPMETLCGQAFGARNCEALGIIFQRALLICGSTACFILAAWTQLEAILVTIGQDPTIAKATAHYTLATAPSLLLLGVSETGKRYLMAQNVVKPLAAIYTIGSLLAPLFNWLFIYGLKQGIMGAAFALAAVNAANSVMLVAYILRHNQALSGTKEAPWLGWSIVALRNLPQYIFIAVPSLLMLCLEWWLFEAMIILAGLLSDPKLSLAAMGILLNVLATVYTFPYGLGSASSTRVANALGRGDHQGAVRTAVVSLAAVLAGQVVLGVVMIIGRRAWGYIFTSEAAVVEAAATVFPLLALTCIGDGVNGIMAGVVRGCGRQSRAAIANACSFWAVGLPLALLLAFKLGLGLAGLWSGLTAATSLQAVVITAMVLRLDWRQEALRAAENVVEEADAVAAAKLLEGSGPRVLSVELSP